MDSSKNISLFIVIFLGLLTAITPLATDLYLPALPIMPHELNTNASLIQMTIGIMTFGISIGQLIGGPLSDSFGRKKPLIIGNFLCVISSILCAYAPNIEVLLIARFLQGLTGSIGVVIAKAISRDYATGKELMRLMSLLMLVNGLAPVIAPLIGGHILLFSTWRFIFIILAIFSIILFIGSLMFSESLSPEKRISGGITMSFKNYSTLLKDINFLGQSLVQLFAFGAFFAYITGSSFIYQNIFNLSAQQFSYMFGLNSCGIILASVLSAKASNIIKIKTILNTSLWQLTIGSLLFLSAMYFNWSFIITSIILFCTVCTVSIFGSAGFSMAMAKYGHQAGSASAILGFAGMFSAGFVSPLVGIGGSHTGIPMGIVMVVCSVLALVCFYTLIKEK